MKAKIVALLFNPKVISFIWTILCVALIAVINFLINHLMSFGFPDYVVGILGIALKEILIDVEAAAPAITTTSAH